MGGRNNMIDKTLTLEQKRELLQDIFGSNEEVIDSVIRFLKEEEDRREKEKRKNSVKNLPRVKNY
jgi:hypothetical protein